MQRRKVNEKQQETFVAEYKLVGLQEELETLKQQNMMLEGERETLKNALQEEEVARIAAEGAVALPASRDADGCASPRKRIREDEMESSKENVDPEAPRIEDELMAINEELRMEKRMRLRADDQVHFLKMECQFQCCSCRLAERHGVEYVHDGSLATQMAGVAPKVVGQCESLNADTAQEPIQEQPSTPARQPSSEGHDTDQLLEFSPSVGISSTAPSPAKPMPQVDVEQIVQDSTPAHEPLPQVIDLPISPAEEMPAFTFPETPRPLPNPPPRTISHTITVTVPLKDDYPFSPAPATPGGISREEALEQIRQRRGRARSIAAGNATPRKRMVEIGELRRDISAPGRV